MAILVRRSPELAKKATFDEIYKELSDELYRMWGIADFYEGIEKWSKAREILGCCKILNQRLVRLHERRLIDFSSEG